MANQIHKNDHDSYASEVNGIPVGVHFYFLDRTLFGTLRENLAPVTQSGQVLSFLYMPFLTRRDIDLLEIPYNQGKYGSIDPKNPDPFAHSKQCYVYKVAPDVAVADKPLGTVQKYNHKKWGRSTSWRWYNESKLFQFPYQYICITDYMNAPLMIAPHLISNPGDSFPVKVRQEISFNGGYTIYAQSYRGDYNGTMEGLQSCSALDLPTGSTAYSEFMANSKSQFLASNHIASRNETLAKYTANKQAQLGYATANMSYNAQIQAGNMSAMGTLLGGIGGGLFGMLGAGVSAGMGLASNRLQANTSKNIANMQTSTAHQLANMSNNVAKKNRIDQSQAYISDIINQPRNISLGSGDILQSITSSRKCVDVLRYGLTDVYQHKIALYFTMYGYKQNKFVRLSNSSIRTRKYFNYIKTIDANVEGRKIPKEILEQIKAIFNSGITFWHFKDMQNINPGPKVAEDPKGGEGPKVANLSMYEYTTVDNVERNIVYPGTNTVIPDHQIPKPETPGTPIVPPGGQQP